MRRLPPRLLALTPGTVGPAHVERFAHAAARAIAAGLEGVLLREPELSDKAVLELAHALRARLDEGVSAASAPADVQRDDGARSERRGWLAVHDRVHLARAARADAIHLGFRSLAPADARSVLPEDVALGFSAHAGDDAAAWAACDYLLLGPVHDTPSKRGVKEPLGLDGFARELARAPRPVWALGGITAANAGEALARGARGVAVRAAVFGAGEPALAVRALLAALDGATSPRTP